LVEAGVQHSQSPMTARDRAVMSNCSRRLSS
jgi:hypothetical protein